VFVAAEDRPEKSFRILAVAMPQCRHAHAKLGTAPKRVSESYSSFKRNGGYATRTFVKLELNP
jgi:hypothetical protein